MPAKLITLSGIDASGKATQSKILAQRLDARLFSFPDYTTPAGKLIADHLQSKWDAAWNHDGVHNNKQLDAFVLQSLMLTNRMELAIEIKDTLKLGRDVVCDRYAADGYAYGRADGIDGDYLLKVQELLPRPQLQLLMDIDPETSVKRRPERRDRYEKQAGLMEEVSKNYHELWNRQRIGARNSWVVINARKTVEEVAADVWQAVMISAE